MAVAFQVAQFRAENAAGTVSLNTKQMASAQTSADPGNRKRQHKTKPPKNFTPHGDNQENRPRKDETIGCYRYSLPNPCNFKMMNDSLPI